jgi:hypothetical protein
MAEGTSRAIQSLKRMGTHMGVPTIGEAGPSNAQVVDAPKKKKAADDEDDERVRFTVTAGGRRMSKMEFITQMSQMDPKARAKFVQSSNVPEAVKTAAHEDAKEHKDTERREAASKANAPAIVGQEGEAEIQKIESPAAIEEGRSRGPTGLTLVDSNNEDVPFHSVHQDINKFSQDKQGETAAQRRRREASQQPTTPSSDETAAERRRRVAALQTSPGSTVPASKEPTEAETAAGFQGETAAERKRRLGALGVGGDDSPESDSDSEEAGDPMESGRGTHTTKSAAPQLRTPGIRFAEQPRIPTKDERAADEEREEKEEKRKSGLGKLFRK